MALILDGNGLIQGLSAGGLPNGSIDADSLASTLDLSSKTMTFGNVSASGITFPASVSASGNPNTLDDYEEGTFTPNIGGTATYYGQVGRYVKIGKIVHCTFDFQVNVIGTGSVSVLSGFPFTSVNTGQPQTGSCSYFQDINTSVIFVGCYLQNNSTAVVFVAGGASGATIAHNAFSIFKNNARILGQITYEVA